MGSQKSQTRLTDYATTTGNKGISSHSVLWHTISPHTVNNYLIIWREKIRKSAKTEEKESSHQKAWEWESSEGKGKWGKWSLQETTGRKWFKKKKVIHHLNAIKRSTEMGITIEHRSWQERGSYWHCQKLPQQNVSTEENRNWSKYGQLSCKCLL